MKMNLDCLRAVLLAIEEEPCLSVSEIGEVSFTSISLQKLFNLLPEFDKENISYSVLLLIDGDYIKTAFEYGSSVSQSCQITRMTLAGHKLLENLRDEKRWQTVKSIASAVRNYSLSALSAIAEGVTSAAIQQAISKAGQ